MAACRGCGKDVAGDFAFCPHCGAPQAEPVRRREVRKVVTVLFCDITGSTELGERLDPEALRLLLARYFERMKTIIESHGGSVEKFIGDAVMAVFGVPTLHEDDALRALRAAVAMRDALPDLGIDGRIGVMTGEVVTGTEERLATGDAVNVAARLEQMAHPGEILIGDATLRLTRDAVHVEAMPPLAAKGKSEPVVAHRLVAVHGDEGLTRRVDTPLVGRTTELRRLRAAYDQAVADQACQLFTILGSAGVGKSRLAAEFLTSLEGARICRGRCLPYGEGITYWPVAEVVQQLPEVELEPALSHGIRALLDDGVVSSSEQIARSFRRLLEVHAADGPLVCVFDDVHWGEETFLDLVESVADLSRGAPILLLCIARPELLDRRPAWAGGKVNSTSTLLESLGAAEADAMISSLAVLDEGLRERIREAAEGNPLFVEQMVALAKESGTEHISVPPTIQALLTARLEQLDDAERSVLERGAVEGRIFHAGAVQTLAPEEDHVVSRLTALVRKELVRPDKPLFAGEDAFRFRHLLIRDAAYDAMPKTTRAELHQRFADWLHRQDGHVVELAEVAGYHLEQAYRYRVELADVDEATAALGRRASSSLADAGRRASERGDTSAAVNLLERAAALLPRDDPDRVQLLPVLGSVLVERGQFGAATAVLEEAIELGQICGLPSVVGDAVITRGFVAINQQTEGTQAYAEAEFEKAARLFEEVGDERGLARAMTQAGLLPFWRGETRLAAERFESALDHARAAGDRVLELSAMSHLLSAMVDGWAALTDASAQADALGGLTTGSSSADVSLLRSRGEIALAQGDHAAAGRFAAAATALAEDLGRTLMANTGIARLRGRLALLAQGPAAAEAVLGPACEFLLKVGDYGHLVSLLPLLADALYELGRIEEIAAQVESVAPAVVREDMDGQVGMRRARAKVQASRGDLAEAERITREALEYAERTDYLPLQGEVHRDLAELLLRSDRTAEAIEALETALALYERKGAAGFAEHVRTRLATVREQGHVT